ncbi:MAG TPA: oligoendopeptidase F, partial [Rhodothermales bacterium]|nr:oligoendopeptidase F [Rhodothermales bacterium]
MEKPEQIEKQATGAEAVHWNLTDLYPNRESLDEDLAIAGQEAEAFAADYRGRIAEVDADELAEALKRFDNLQDRLGRAFTYAYLQWSTNTEDAARGALLQKVREAYTQISQQLIFFELEWAALPEDKAKDLLETPQLEPFRHYLELQLLHKEHLLTEPEEKILAEKSITGAAAWSRFF